MNYGVHFHINEIPKYQHSIEILFKSLKHVMQMENLAQATVSTLIWRESFAQHFDREGGEYFLEGSKRTTENCADVRFGKEVHHQVTKCCHCHHHHFHHTTITATTTAATITTITTTITTITTTTAATSLPSLFLPSFCRPFCPYLSPLSFHSFVAVARQNRDRHCAQARIFRGVFERDSCSANRKEPTGVEDTVAASA
jgi:hypothetical protein